METNRLNRLALLLCSAGILTLSACGGGDDNSAAPPVAAPPPPAPATTDIATTVIDGAIGNALVCLDVNDNGVCDSGEVSGRTDATGKVTLTVLLSDAGKHALVAQIGTDAVDADTGPVTTPYTLTAPADQIAVISPLTTLVQLSVASTGATTGDAAQSVQSASGITSSPLVDFTKTVAPTDGSANPAAIARLIVLTMQAQSAAVAPAIGTNAIDGKAITTADANNAVLAQTLALLPTIASAAGDPTVLAATTPAALEAALKAQAQTVATNSGVTAASLPSTVGIVNQAKVTDPGAYVPTGGYNLRTLTYTDASNYFMRVSSSTLAEDTPDADNNTRYIDRRRRVSAGNVSAWGAGSDPWRNADVHWNGSAWVNCPINFENVSSVRDAQGNSTYNYCDKTETGRSNRATFDISGRTLAEVYVQLRTGGYTNITLPDTSVLGTATFPTGSQLRYQVTTPSTEAIAYYPGGTNTVAQYSAAVSAGGDASAQPAGTACNSDEATFGRTTATATLETMVARATGTPCKFGTTTFVYGGVTYSSDTPDYWWGNSTVSIGTLGSAPVGSGPAPGFYTTNTLIRIAFTGGNAVTYYACKQRFNTGSIRACSDIGTGTYAIAPLGDARALTLTNPPALAAPLTYSRVFVERGGLIYFGYQGKPVTTSQARFNATGSTAFLTQLAITPDDPSKPLALTLGSYQGIWDGARLSLYVATDGGITCQNRSTQAFFTCTAQITDAATGAFTYADGTSTLAGTMDFATGAGAGTYHNPTLTPADGSFTLVRR